MANTAKQRIGALTGGISVLADPLGNTKDSVRIGGHRLSDSSTQLTLPSWVWTSAFGRLTDTRIVARDFRV